jgi:hypothetical protein
VDPIPLGIIFGIVLVAFDLTMLARLHWATRDQEIEALAAAAIERFMLGLLIPTADLGTPRWLAGVILGLTLSLPTAILTRAYQPIIGVGLVAGLVLGIGAQSVL